MTVEYGVAHGPVHVADFLVETRQSAMMEYWLQADLVDCTMDLY